MTRRIFVTKICSGIKTLGFTLANNYKSWHNTRYIERKIRRHNNRPECNKLTSHASTPITLVDNILYTGWPQRWICNNFCWGWISPLLPFPPSLPSHPLTFPLEAGPLKSSYGAWESATSSPSGVLGGAPAEIDFGTLLSENLTSCGKNFHFY